MAIFHARIKELRIQHGYTLATIAEKLGVTEATAQRYETGRGIKTIPYEVIEKYANILGCSPSYLMGWDQEKIDAAEKLLADKAAADDALEAELIERLRQIDMEQIRTLNEILALGLTDAEMKDLLDYARFLISKRKVD